MDEKLRQQTDMERTIRCNIPDQMMEMNIGERNNKQIFRYFEHTYYLPKYNQARDQNKFHRLRHGRKNSNVNVDSHLGRSWRRIRVWLELGAHDGSGTVEVGQSTTLGIRAVLPGSVGVRIVDCAAIDGLGESSQKLLDERGCPVDEQVSAWCQFKFITNRRNKSRKAENHNRAAI